MGHVERRGRTTELCYRCRPIGREREKDGGREPNMGKGFWGLFKVNEEGYPCLEKKLKKIPNRAFETTVVFLRC